MGKWRGRRGGREVLGRGVKGEKRGVCGWGGRRERKIIEGGKDEQGGEEGS